MIFVIIILFIALIFVVLLMIAEAEKKKEDGEAADKLKYNAEVSFSEDLHNATAVDEDNNQNIIFKVEGCFVAKRRNHLVNYCQPGDLVELVPEPNNPYDKNAIRIRSNGKLIGYVSQYDTDTVREIMLDKHTATLLRVTENYDYISAYITLRVID